METLSGSSINNLKRKKKRSFMQQVKKRFKKNPSFVKGRSFDTTEYEYFLRVLELERSFEGTPEEKQMFVNNALAQTENKEVECSYNQLISRVVENLLQMASDEVLERYFDAFAVNFRPITVHEYASHVLQALMVLAARHSLEDSKSEEHIAACSNWLLKASRFLLNNIEEFMWDTYANQCLRTAMLCVAGQPQLDKHNKGESDEQKHYNVPEDYTRLLEEFYTRISTWPQFKDLVNDSLSSGYFQTLLKALKPVNKKLHKTFCHKILAECFPSRDDESPALSSPPAMFVLEVMIDQGKKKLLKIIYEQLIATRVVEMSTAKMGNVTLRKYLNKCNNSDILTEIVNALMRAFPKILANNGGVLVSVCQACERTKVAQSEFYQGLLKSLNCDSVESSPQLICVILSLSPLPHSSDQTPLETKQGSLMLQSLFNFQKPIKLVNSLLSYESRKLAELLSSQYGSFLSGAFCKSQFIGEKSRLKLINHLVGNYSFLAQSKFGSRSFDEIWEVADVKHKGKIVQDLAAEYSEVMKSRFGQFVASKVFLELYRSQGLDKWKSKAQSIQSKKNLFASIIQDVK